MSPLCFKHYSFFYDWSRACPSCLIICRVPSPILYSPVFLCMRLASSWSSGLLGCSQISLEVLPGASGPLNSSSWPRMLFPWRLGWTEDREWLVYSPPSGLSLSLIITFSGNQYWPQDLNFNISITCYPFLIFPPLSHLLSTTMQPVYLFCLLSFSPQKAPLSHLSILFTVDFIFSH